MSDFTVVDRVISLFLPGEVEEEEGRMAAGTETCPPPVLMIIVLALSRELQAKKVLLHILISCGILRDNQKLYQVPLVVKEKANETLARQVKDENSRI